MNPLFAGARTYQGLEIQVVEPGTKVIDGRTGQSETVSDNETVVAGNKLHCTNLSYQRLKQEFENNSATYIGTENHD